MYITSQEMADLMPDATVLLSDEPEMESSTHYTQLSLLVTCLEWLWRDRQDYFIGATLTIYFSRQELKNRDFRGPDFFLVKNTEKKPRNSWVVWEENGQYPNLIIELLSDSTANVDRKKKKNLYQDIFRTPEYFWFDPETLEFEGFHLIDGKYQSIPLNQDGRRWSKELGLFLGIDDNQLRFFTADGLLVPTPSEAALQYSFQSVQERQRAEQERQRAEQESLRAEEERQRAEQESLRAEEERQRAEQESLRAEEERQRAERLAEQLRSLGIEPEV